MRSLLRSASTLGNSLASYAINLHPPTLKNITKHNLTFSENNPFTILLPHLPKTAFLTEDYQNIKTYYPEMRKNLEKLKQKYV